LPLGYGTDAATDGFAAIQFDFAGVAGTHETAGRNGDSSTGSDLEQGFPRFRVDRNIIGQKVNANTHDRILKNI
jgi:hypothetical protein